MTPAGVSAVAAAAALLISGACIVVFFTTEVDAWGRANDATIALFALLMIPPVAEVSRRYATGPIRVAGAVGICGLLVVAVSSGLTAAAKLDWLLSAKIGAVGFAGYLVWMSAASVRILGPGGLPDALGWFGLATVLIIGLVVGLSVRFIRIHGSLSGEVQPPIRMWVVFGVAFLCLTAWTILLGVSL